MYGDLVRDLLKKYFGEPKYSLTLGAAGEATEKTEKTQKQNKSFYYSFAKEKEIAALRELLSMSHLVEGIGKLPDLDQSLSASDGEGGQAPQCAVFTGTDENWTVSFFDVTGVTYHRTYANRASATLRLGEHPFVMLSDAWKDDLYGFFRKVPTKKKTACLRRDGLSYWMNKTLKNNPRFRDFAADFFSSVAETERIYILKDAARTIKRCGCFLVNVTYAELREARTPAELIKKFLTEGTELRVDFNKTDLNLGYLMAMLAGAVDPRDRKFVEKLNLESVEDFFDLKFFYEGFGADRFVVFYYRNKFKNSAVEEIEWFVDDYVRMCVGENDSFRLGLGAEALVRAHDELAARISLREYGEELRDPIVTVPSVFDAFDAALKTRDVAGEFERVITGERLLKEGQYQHNCVFSRRDLIKRDLAAVYSWKHEKESYTVQFSVDQGGRCAVSEIRARFNGPVKEGHMEYLRELLKGICTVPSGKSPQYAAPYRGRGPYPRAEDGFGDARARLEDFAYELNDDDLPF